MSPGSDLVGPEQVREAAARLRGLVLRTPLLPARDEGRASAREAPAVWLKCENLQIISAFKVRGALNFVSRLPPERRGAGLVTYSSGNHAQGVAFAARTFGLQATIVMPVDVPRVKLDATRALGARVELVGTTSSERRSRAEEIVAETGATMVPPFDHPHIIAGQGTVGLEILEQLPTDRPPVVVVPIGGGGLISGIAAVVKGERPGARIVGVEPEGAASMKTSLERGEPVSLERADTVADGLKPLRPGDLTFRHCQLLVDEVVTVGDSAIREGVLRLFRSRLVAEPSGAATLAALVAGPLAGIGEEENPVVAVVSGGNVDPALLAEWLSADAERPT